MLGKSLCGPSFSLNFGNFGFSSKPVSSRAPNLSSTSLPKVLDSTNCSRLYQQMRSIGGPVIGNLLTPLLFGKILYTPRTNLTERLIRRVSFIYTYLSLNFTHIILVYYQFNKTFIEFERLKHILTSFSDNLAHFDDLKPLTANLTVINYKLF